MGMDFGGHWCVQSPGFAFRLPAPLGCVAGEHLSQSLLQLMPQIYSRIMLLI